MKNKLVLQATYAVFVIFILFLLYRSSCVKKEISIKKYSKFENQKTLQKGEWISNLDTLCGISVRDNKIAFFKNMEFKSDDIYEYLILDSIYKIKNNKIKIVEFLVMKNFSDTVYYPIIRKNYSSITLKINKIKIETFTLKSKSLKAL